MRLNKNRILGLVLASAFGLMTHPALAQSRPSMMPLGGSTMQRGTINSLPVPLTPSNPASTSGNFTFIPRGDMVPGLPAANESAGPVYSTDPERTGYGEGLAAGEMPQQVLPAPLPVSPSANVYAQAPAQPHKPMMDWSGEPTLNPAAPPNAMLPAYVPANTRTALRPVWPGTLTDGQSFSGLVGQPQQAGFYTLVATTQAEFENIWHNHIGQEPPAAQLEPGQAAVFATTGPRSFNGYNVRLSPFTGAQKLQVIATEISPSQTVAQSRVDISPWQMLILRTNGAKVEILRRRELAGSAFSY